MKKFTNIEIIENISLHNFFSNEDIKQSKNNLKITNKGIYTITKHNDAEWISKCIIETLNTDFKNMSITDCTAGVGGNTINFSKYFKQVYSVELNPVTYGILKHNVFSLNLKNVFMKNENIIDLISQINSDIVFVDPPWGGTLYKKIKYFNLKLGKMPISYLVNRFFDNKNIKYVVLKCPYNINTTPILKHCLYSNIKIFKNHNMWIIIFF